MRRRKFDGLSENEVRRRLESLTESDYADLRDWAAKCMNNRTIMGKSGDDIASEAVLSVLTGARNWPTDVEMRPLLFSIVRSLSIATHNRRR